jgi:hypothetical protein
MKTASQHFGISTGQLALVETVSLEQYGMRPGPSPNSHSREACPRESGERESTSKKENPCSEAIRTVPLVFIRTWYDLPKS